MKEPRIEHIGANWIQYPPDHGASKGLWLPPLCNAARNRDTQAIEELLQGLRGAAPVDPNSKTGQNWYGNTALHFASSNGDEEICRMLLECGSRPDVRNMMGDAPLDVSTSDMVTTLIGEYVLKFKVKEAKCATQRLPIPEMSISEEVVIDEVLAMLTRYRDYIRLESIEQRLIGSPYEGLLSWLLDPSLQGKERWERWSGGRQHLTREGLSHAIVSYLRGGEPNPKSLILSP